MTKQEFEALIPFDDSVRGILGRICFQCTRIAEVLRLGGLEIDTRAEDEQAEVIYYLLRLRIVHGPERWADAVNAELNDILKETQVRD
jgi:hypothetical protein